MGSTRESKTRDPERARTVLRSGLLVLALAGLFLTGCQRQAETPTTEATEATETESPTAAADREPKNLEAKITIVMGEELPQMYFATSDGTNGGPFTLPSGKTVGIKVVNSGKLEHEIAFGRDLSAEGAYTKNLFADLDADLFVFKPVKMEFEEATFGEIEAEPGGEFWIRTKFPAELKGDWEIGCFVEGHYDAGMKAKLIIE